MREKLSRLWDFQAEERRFQSREVAGTLFSCYQDKGLDSGSYFWPWKEALAVIFFANLLKGTKESRWRLPGKKCFFPKDVLLSFLSCC